MRTKDFEWDESGVLTVRDPALAKIVEGHIKSGGLIDVRISRSIATPPHETEPIDFLCILFPPPPPPPPEVTLTLRVRNLDLDAALRAYMTRAGTDSLKVKAGGTTYELIENRPKITPPRDEKGRSS